MSGIDIIVWFLLRGSVVITLGYLFLAFAWRSWKIESPFLRQFTCLAIMGIACFPWSFPVEIAWYSAIKTEAAETSALPAIIPLDHAALNQPADKHSRQNVNSTVINQLSSDQATNGKQVHRANYFRSGEWLALVWLVGCVSFLIVGTFRYFVFHWQVSQLPLDRSTWWIEWRNMQREQKVHPPIPLLVTERLGPMLALLHDDFQLIVPRDYWHSLTREQRRGIMLHELEHYLRGDIYTACLIRLLALPFWFHPLAWRIVAQFDEAAEWACDRAVLQQSEPLAYAKALEQLAQCNLPNFSLAMGQCAQTHPLVTRVRRVLNPVPSEDSAMKNLLFTAALCTAAICAFVNIRLVAQDKPPASIQKVQEEVKAIEEKISEIKATAEKTKAAAQELKDRVDEHLNKIKSLATGSELTAEGKRRIEAMQSGEEAKQLAALQGAEKMGDEGLILCGYAAKEGVTEKVRRQALEIGCLLGEAGLPVLAHAYESLSVLDRLFVIEQLAKQDSEVNRIVLARISRDENEEIHAAAIGVGMKMKEPLVFLALAGEGSDKIAATVLKNLDALATADRVTILLVSALKSPAEFLPATIQAAGKLKQQGYPVIAAAYKRNDAAARAEIVKLFRKSSEPIEQFVVQEALKDSDPALKAAAEKAKAE